MATTLKFAGSNTLLYLWQKIRNTFVAKESGKGLSSEDYTTAEKTKLAGVEAGAQVNPGSATTTDAGLMSAADKVKLDGIAAGATAVTIDSALSSSSANPVQNQVINAALNGKANKTDTVLETTLSRGRKASTTVGTGSFAFGNEVIASGSYSHAEGSGTTSIGSGAHAEGGGTSASGSNAHAEGYLCMAGGEDSHAEGIGTKAHNKSQHVFGAYNVVTSPGVSISSFGTHVEIVGNGSSDNARSNARTLDWSGNEELAGDLTINKGAAGEVKVGTKLTALENAQGDLAPKASPALTGTPTAPTAAAGTNTTQIATTEFVTSAVASAIGSITGLSFSIVQSLPQTGSAGIIYLLSNNGSSPNSYDEYVWLSDNSAFEKIGTTDVDLSDYLQDSDAVEITNAEVDTIIATASA